MIMQVTFQNFVDAFKRMGRYDSWGYDALETLFNHLNYINPDIELDVIEICCENTKYENLLEFLKDYGYKFEEKHRRLDEADNNETNGWIFSEELIDDIIYETITLTPISSNNVYNILNNKTAFIIQIF